MQISPPLLLRLLRSRFYTSFFSGILDQGSGVLIVYDGSESDQTYTYALDTITHMGKVVDVLFKKAQKLS